MKEKLNELKKLIENCEVDGYYGNTHDIQDALNKLTELEQLTIPIVVSSFCPCGKVTSTKDCNCPDTNFIDDDLH